MALWFAGMSSAGSTLRRMALALCALLGAATFGVAAAVAEDDEPVPKPPLYTDGRFPSIPGPDGPEQFSWRVELGPSQKLVQIDDRRIDVVFQEPDEPPHTSFSIQAVDAHDAAGASVPTTIAIVESDVFTLTVHHRAGNPAAGGAPFAYPVSPGPGWDAPSPTTTLVIPEGERPAPTPACVVPRLAKRTLPSARTALRAAGCRLGQVRGPRKPGARVARQFRAPGTVLRAGARVAVKLRAPVASRPSR